MAPVVPKAPATASSSAMRRHRAKCAQARHERRAEERGARLASSSGEDARSSEAEATDASTWLQLHRLVVSLANRVGSLEERIVRAESIEEQRFSAALSGFQTIIEDAFDSIETRLQSFAVGAARRPPPGLATGECRSALSAGAAIESLDEPFPLIPAFPIPGGAAEKASSPLLFSLFEDDIADEPRLVLGAACTPASAPAAGWPVLPGWPLPSGAFGEWQELLDEERKSAARSAPCAALAANAIEELRQFAWMAMSSLLRCWVNPMWAPWILVSRPCSLLMRSWRRLSVQLWLRMRSR